MTEATITKVIIKTQEIPVASIVLRNLGATGTERTANIVLTVDANVARELPTIVTVGEDLYTGLEWQHRLPMGDNKAIVLAPIPEFDKMPELY